MCVRAPAEGRTVKTIREIPSMPGQYQLSLDRFGDAVGEVAELGIPAVILFGIPGQKDATGTAACDDRGIVQEALRIARKIAPGLLLITDVCFCEYTDHGHCGPLKECGGRIDVGRDRTDAGRDAVAHDEGGVVAHQRRDLLLVGLELLERLLRRGGLVGRVLELDHDQRNAVDEQHDVRPAVVFALDDGVLIDREPVVAVGVREVDEPRLVVNDAAVSVVLNVDAVGEHPVEVAVALDQARRVDAGHLPEGFVKSVSRDLPVDGRQGASETIGQQHLTVRGTLSGGLTGGDIGPMQQ